GAEERIGQGAQQRGEDEDRQGRQGQPGEEPHRRAGRSQVFSHFALLFVSALKAMSTMTATTPVVTPRAMATPSPPVAADPASRPAISSGMRGKAPVPMSTAAEAWVPKAEPNISSHAPSRAGVITGRPTRRQKVREVPPRLVFASRHCCRRATKLGRVSRIIVGMRKYWYMRMRALTL